MHVYAYTFISQQIIPALCGGSFLHYTEHKLFVLVERTVLIYY